MRAAGEGPLYGPFRDRRAAEKARDALQRTFPLRPCDYDFEPDPALPLGLACLYAQVRSCAAPCLARVSEAEYRDARGAAPRTGSPIPARAERGPALFLPRSAAASAAPLVVDAGRRSIGLLPVRGGPRARRSGTGRAAPDELEAAVRPAGVARGRTRARTGHGSAPGFAAPSARASFVVVARRLVGCLRLAAVRAALATAFARPRGGW